MSFENTIVSPSERRLLVAEDDPDFAFLLRRLLQKLLPQIDLSLVGNGVAAVDDVMGSGLPSMLITDLQMPYMDGFELIAWMRAQSSPQQIPILVISGSLDERSIQKCRQLGADDFIPKHANRREMEDHLRRVLSPNAMETSSR